MSQPAQLLASDDAVASLIFSALQLEGFFPELTPEQLSKLFPRSALYGYCARTVVVREGDLARDLYVVCDGRVEITRGPGAQPLAVLGRGDILGEMAYVTKGTRTATATTTKASRIYRLAYDDIGYVYKHNPKLADHLHRLAEQRRRA